MVPFETVGEKELCCLLNYKDLIDLVSNLEYLALVGCDLEFNLNLLNRFRRLVKNFLSYYLVFLFQLVRSVPLSNAQTLFKAFNLVISLQCCHHIETRKLRVF